jgi:hypothetical protein
MERKTQRKNKGKFKRIETKVDTMEKRQKRRDKGKETQGRESSRGEENK